MSPTTPSLHRPAPILRDPAAAARGTFDLIVVGGGIYGIAATLEAGRRGLRTLLLERDDFAAATTANHLRTLHGGIRYLQSMDLPRFYESVCERRWFSQHFPGLVEPIPCLMPLYGNGVKRREVFLFGLLLNDILSSQRNRGVVPARHLPTSRIVSTAETQRIFPSVDGRGLKGSARWYDIAMPEPQRLVLTLMHAAAGTGATFLNYTEATALTTSDGRVTGVRALDHESGREFDFAAPKVLIAAGPATRALAARWHKDQPALFHRGLLLWNLLLRRPALSHHALALTPDRGRGHTYFLHTWKGRLLVGTGEALMAEGDLTTTVAPERLAETIDDLNRAVPGLDLTAADVERVYSGQLPATPGGKLANRPIIVDHGAHGGPGGLWSVTGVKFTTARRVADALLSRLDPRGPVAPHRFPDPTTGPMFEYGWLPAENDRSWFYQLKTLIAEEAVLHLDDLLLRRTSLADNPGRLPSLFPTLRPLFPDWDEARWQREIDRVNQRLRSAVPA